MEPQLLGQTESDLEKMDWDGYSPPLRGMHNATIKKNEKFHEDSKDEYSESEVSDTGNGTKDTVVSMGRRAGRATELTEANWHKDRSPARTSTPK